MQTEEDIRKYFDQLIKDDPGISATLAAIKTLMHYVQELKVETIMELRARVKDAINTLKQTDLSTTSIESGCELFLRFITLANFQTQSNYSECKKILLKRGDIYLRNMMNARSKIAQNAKQFIRDGSVILTHSKSRVVLQVLREAAKDKRFSVFITESYPDQSGTEAARELTNLGIPTTVILDAAIGYVMERVNFVLVGAEGVVESGGIINKIGTYTMAICAKRLNKKVYVAAESFKFHRVYPLNQNDLPNEYKYQASRLRSGVDLAVEHPLVDYTPPEYIYLFLTDIGIHMPAAVSDMLINLYL